MSAIEGLDPEQMTRMYARRCVALGVSVADRDVNGVALDDAEAMAVRNFLFWLRRARAALGNNAKSVTPPARPVTLGAGGR
ncbi:MAG: hypothetical protein ACTH93_05205 [Pseudoclavibacter sp.]